MIPDKIKIRREENYHTHLIGKYDNEKQFMAFIVGVPHGTDESRHKQDLRWYGVLHRFNSDGSHLGTGATLLGVKPSANLLENADSVFADMLASLGPLTYGDVEVRLFSVRVDGQAFGLIAVSEPEEEYQRIDLVPNGLAFFPPWDGTYST